ncbi:hypothetical protein C0J52_26697 [Blattella germanica]|nr:hypothetical protein C0J52_26697 [Blattella germanica]
MLVRQNRSLDIDRKCKQDANYLFCEVAHASYIQAKEFDADDGYQNRHYDKALHHYMLVRQNRSCDIDRNSKQGANYPFCEVAHASYVQAKEFDSDENSHHNKAVNVAQALILKLKAINVENYKKKCFQFE